MEEYEGNKVDEDGKRSGKGENWDKGKKEVCRKKTHLKLVGSASGRREGRTERRTVSFASMTFSRVVARSTSHTPEGDKKRI